MVLKLGQVAPDFEAQTTEGPIRFHELLNAFFRDIADAALECEAEIHKYVGDEAILTWPDATANADGEYLACRLVAGDERHPRSFIQTGTEIDVDEVEPHGMLANAHLAGARRGEFGVLIDQGLWTSDLVHPHGFGHRPISSSVFVIASE